MDKRVETKVLEPDEAKAVRIAELKQKIAGIKKCISTAPLAIKDKSSKSKPKNKGSGNQAWINAGVATRFQTGGKGNTSGAPKTQVKFWRYVVAFLEMKRAEVEDIDEDDLLLAQIGAKKFALAVAEGKWVHTKEVLDRELGRPREGLGDGDEEGPKLVKLPFKITG